MNWLRIFKEVRANMRSRPAMTVGLILFSILLGFGATLWSTTTASSVNSQWERLVSNGFTSFDISATGERLIDAQTCENLNDIPEVMAAGSSVRVRYGSFRALEAGSGYVTEATPGYVRANFPQELEVTGHPVVMGAGFFETHGVTAGATLEFIENRGQFREKILIDYVAQTQTMVDGTNGTIFKVVDPTGDVNSCLVRVKPGYVAAISHVVGAAFDDTSVIVSPLMHDDPLRTAPQDLLDSRPTRFVGIAAGGILLAALFTTWWLRRVDLSLYRVMGTPTRGILIMTSLETLFLTVVPLHTGVLAALGVMTYPVSPVVVGAAVTDVLPATALLIWAPWISILLLKLADPAKILRVG